MLDIRVCIHCIHLCPQPLRTVCSSPSSKKVPHRYNHSCPSPEIAFPCGAMAPKHRGRCSGCTSRRTCGTAHRVSTFPLSTHCLPKGSYVGPLPAESAHTDVLASADTLCGSVLLTLASLQLPCERDREVPLAYRHAHVQVTRALVAGLDAIAASKLG